MRHATERGYSLIELILAVSVLLVVFVGVIGVFRMGVEILSLNKARGAALTLAQEQIEYVRSLSYNAVGTVSGIPAGVVPQTETVTLNNIPYERRTFIQYYDDPADGLDGADETGVITDYKLVKVEVSWDQLGEPRSVSLITTVVPRGVESNVPGGTLRINVIDSLGAPIESARVDVENAGVSPSVDLTAYTNAAGVVLLPGAPGGGGYEISATKLGYSTAQTHSATTENPNPNPAHISVVEGNTSTITLAIDQVATLEVRTREPMVADQFTDSFGDASGLDELVDTVAGGGSLRLADTGGVYASTGSARSLAVAPSLLARWETAQVDLVQPTDTSVSYRLWYDAGGTFELVPESELPGNVAGLTNALLDLTDLPVATYGALQLEALFDTSDTATTSQIASWTLTYAESLVPVGSVPFSLRGTKVVGEDAGGQPVYKYDEVHVTDGSGELVVADLEWDGYTLSVDPSSGWMPAEICPTQPQNLSSGESAITEVAVVPVTTNALRVVVHDTNAMPVHDASVQLVRSGYDVTRETTTCGQTHFSGLANAADYALTVTKSGYTTTALSNVAVDGVTVLDVVLNP